VSYAHDRVNNRLNVVEQCVIPCGANSLGIQKFLLQIESDKGSVHKGGWLLVVVVADMRKMWL